MRQGNRIAGKVLLFEPGLGQVEALLSGDWTDDDKVSVTLHQFTGNYSIPVVLPQTGTMNGRFDPVENIMVGDWKTDAQTAGKFLLVKIEGQQTISASTNAPLETAPPLQVAPANPAAIPALISKTVVLGSYRLSGEDIRRLADLVKSGTNVTLPAVNASYGERSTSTLGWTTY